MALQSSLENVLLGNILQVTVPGLSTQSDLTSLMMVGAGHTVGYIFACRCLRCFCSNLDALCRPLFGSSYCFLTVSLTFLWFLTCFQRPLHQVISPLLLFTGIPDSSAHLYCLTLSPCSPFLRSAMASPSREGKLDVRYVALVLNSQGENGGLSDLFME